MKNILAAFARNKVFANILLTIIFLAGYLATISMIVEVVRSEILERIGGFNDFAVPCTLGPRRKDRVWPRDLETI